MYFRIQHGRNVHVGQFRPGLAGSWRTRNRLTEPRLGLYKVGLREHFSQVCL